MKSLVVFSCLVIAAAIARADDETKKFNGVMGDEMRKCMDELKLDPELMKKMEEQTLSEDEQREMGCLRACVMKKANILENSKINQDMVDAMIEKMYSGHPEEITKRQAFTQPCMAEVESLTEECEIANTFTNCYMAKLKNA